MNFDENNVVSGKLRYQGTLDISFYTIYQSDNMRYKARINAKPGLPKAVYIIINIISIVQLIGPCLFVDSTFLWDKDSVFTKFMKSIGCIWQLWSGKSRIYAGIVFSIIVFIFEIFSGIWAGIISKKQVLKKGESYISLLSGKYIRPIFTILAFSSFPESIERAKTDKISILCIIFIILVALIGPLDLYLMSARILVENNPNHEWDQFYPFLSFLVTTVLVMLSSSVGFVNKTIQVVLMILCAVIYALFAVYIFITAPTIKRNFSIITCSFSSTGCIVSILSIIFLYTNGVNSALLLVLFIIFSVICYIILTFLNKRRVSKVMMIFSQCESNPEGSEEILKKHFKSANQFIYAVHISFQYWPPFLLSWKPFSIFTQEYRGNPKIFLLWIRICALFPQETELFIYLIRQYANLKIETYSRNSFLTQMLIIQSSRNLESTPIIMKNITSIVKRIEVAHLLEFRFWERILQKSTEVFWPSVRSLSKVLDKIDNNILQLISSYPNNKDLVTLYCSFLQNVKFDFIKYQEWSDKLKQLNDGVPLQPDIVIQSARYFLPEIQQYCLETHLRKQDESQSEILETKSTEIDFQNLLVRISLQNLVTKSRIGSITLGVVILLIGTILSILAFVWYSSKFRARYVTDPIHKIDFMRAVNGHLFHFGFLANYVALHPLFISGALSVCNASNINNTNCTNLMNKISPILYPLGRIDPWIYDESFTQDAISALRETIIQIQYSLGNLTHSPGCKGMYNRLFVEPFIGDFTPVQILLKCIVDSTSILNTANFDEYKNKEIIRDFDHTVDLVSDELLLYPSRMVEVSIAENGNVRLGLETYFQISIIATLILIALPFNLSYYMLKIESGLVTLAFTSLPNTAVREIMQNINAKNNNKSGNNNNASGALIAKVESDFFDTLQMLFIFFLSIVMVLAACLYLYYLSYDYSETLDGILSQASSYQKPDYYTLFILYRILRASSFNLIPLVVNMTKEELANLTILDQIAQLTVAEKGIAGLEKTVNGGLWGFQGTMSAYFKSKAKLDYFRDVIPSFTDMSANSGILTVFEELVNVDVTQQFDLLVKYLYLFAREALENPDLDYLNSKYFLSLVYYGTVFAATNRFQAFFNSVDKTLTSKIQALNDNIKGLIAGVAIVQVVAFFLIAFHLYSKSKLVKKALLMLLFFNPQVILSNQNVMGLLTKRSMKNLEDESSYLDAEKVIENTDEAALIMDKKLIINDVNDAFLNCIEEPKEKIIGKSINDIFKTAKSGQSLQLILLKLNEIFKGNASPTFKERIAIAIPNGKEKDVFINVICLTSSGSATESNFNEICAVAFIINDQTEQRKIEQKIMKEKEKITSMLNKVLPATIIEELQKGSGSISLSVQSASIGFIEVVPMRPFDPNDFNAPFKFLAKVYDMLDEMIKEFPLLAKIRANSFIYEYAGGIFGSINKPDKHAEEAARFALKVISSSVQIGEKAGTDIQFKIGLSTGGPLVAGVISLVRPTFHLIGPTVDLAQRMKCSGILNQVHVTRAVYELIYAYNFHVTDRGDIDTGGGKILRTYIINP